MLLEKFHVISDSILESISICILANSIATEGENLDEKSKVEGGASGMQEENWQEPMVLDEELLGKCGSNGETQQECLGFNPEVEFRKPHFELKIGHKFSNFEVFRCVGRMIGQRGT